MSARRFDAVLFDMDGTLVDSEPVQGEVTRAMMAGYGVAWEEDGEFLGCTDLDMFTALVARHGLAEDAMTLTTRRAALMVEMLRKGVTPMPGPRGKPAPDIFLEAARQLGVPPARCLVIEDSRNGMLAAKAAGMACAAIPCATSRHQSFAEADWRLDSLVDLPSAARL